MISKPKINDVWYDDEGRRLNITEVNIGDRLGREVIGIVRNIDGEYNEYSCSLPIWKDIWLDKRPRMLASQMKGI